jgi:geranylgeranyl diphosphate synthase type II
MPFGGAHNDRLLGIKASIDEALDRIARDAAARGGRVGDAVAYSLSAPGKRIRPVITVLTTEVLGGDAAVAVSPACAIEMIHAASLVLDDLPCMDDATLRRGQPACHVEFGEDIAVLAAFSLLNDAYRMVAEHSGLGEGQRLALLSLLPKAIGFEGLISGQEKDLQGIERDYEEAHHEKTGALFVAAAKAGAIVAGVSATHVEALGAYATHLGLAFQTLDDFVDTFGDKTSAGKDVGQDAERGNVVSIVGRDRAMKRMLLHVQRAVRALEPCGPATEPLSALAHSLMDGARSLTRDVRFAAATSG